MVLKRETQIEISQIFIETSRAKSLKKSVIFVVYLGVILSLMFFFAIFRFLKITTINSYITLWFKLFISFIFCGAILVSSVYGFFTGNLC